MMTFDDLNINKPLRQSLADCGFVTPTTIQQNTYSVALSGRDVLGIAQTGTGKTLGYLLPCLNQWKFSKEPHPQILILVPTRELVVQVVEVISTLVTYMNVRFGGVYGGVGMQPQAAMIAEGVDVLVGTPGRLLDLALNGHLSLRNVRRLVIDEVDEMLEQGFRTQLGRVFDLLPKRRQNLMFSATLTEDIENLMNVYFDNPVKVEAAPTGTPLENIDQHCYQVPNFNTKVNLLTLLLKQNAYMDKVLVFVGSMALADIVFESVEQEFGDEIDYIHSRRTQSQRFGAVRRFKEGSLRILIATDVVARGIDVTNVSHVINFDLPNEPEQYIHRIGRTGRADKHGDAIAFCSPLESEKLEEIESLMAMPIPKELLPEDLAISDKLSDFEQPTYKMRNTLVKVAATPGGAFHERSDKNSKKYNIKPKFSATRMKKLGKPDRKKKKR